MAAAEMFGESTPRIPDNSGRMRLVHHRKRIVTARHFDEARQIKDVAVHRKDAVRDGETATMLAAERKLAVKVVHVAVSVDEHVRAGKTASVDDRGVVQLVGENGVALTDQRGNRANVRHVARAVDNRRLAPLEVRKRALQANVRRLRAGREPRAARARAPFASGFRSGADDARIAREVKVIVRS